MRSIPLYCMAFRLPFIWGCMKYKILSYDIAVSRSHLYVCVCVYVMHMRWHTISRAISKTKRHFCTKVSSFHSNSIAFRFSRNEFSLLPTIKEIGNIEKILNSHHPLSWYNPFKICFVVKFRSKTCFQGMNWYARYYFGSKLANLPLYELLICLLLFQWTINRIQVFIEHALN